MRSVFLFFLLAIVFCSIGSPLAASVDLFEKLNVAPVKNAREIPAMSLEYLDGGRCNLKSLRGKVIFLNFWATWCGPCREEMEAMDALYQKFKDRGFVLLAISLDYGGSKQVRSFMEKKRYTFSVLLDPRNESLEIFGVSRIPTTLIVDRQGRIVGRAVGPRDWSSPEAESLVQWLLGN